MLNLLVVYDNEDVHRGDYFQASYQHLFDNTTIDTNYLNRRFLHTTAAQTHTIDHHTGQFNGQPFVFVAYAHGSENELFLANMPYIHRQNAYLFAQTLFYACSCWAAKELGQNLRQQGCKVFIGYDAPISTLNPETEPFYYTCENAFLTYFLNTRHSIQDCLSLMYDKYEEMRRHLLTHYGLFEASVLENNLNAFKIMCAEEDLALTKEDFFVL